MMRSPDIAQEPRRFPPPWAIVELDERFAVVDAKGLNLVYLYFAEGSRGFYMQRLTRDEACRIANAIARLPQLLGSQSKASA